MAHKAQENYVVSAIQNIDFSNLFILEFGAFTVNRSIRGYFPNPRLYIGVDAVEGPGVDAVSKAHEYNPPEPPDIVISCEMLEHDPFCRKSIQHMASILKPGGTLILTAATIGRAVHGTRQAEPAGSPANTRLPEFMDYYRNIEIEDILAGLGKIKFDNLKIELNHIHHDIYLTGVKSKGD
jgi:SAM-dependent methyltransferase